jgi:hypothetical protein
MEVGVLINEGGNMGYVTLPLTIYNTEARKNLFTYVHPGTVLVIDDAYYNINQDNKVGISVSPRATVFLANDNVIPRVEEVVVYVEEDTQRLHKGTFNVSLNMPIPFNKNGSTVSIALVDTKNSYRVRASERGRSRKTHYHAIRPSVTSLLSQLRFNIPRVTLTNLLSFSRLRFT